jgi:hypothetical protein
VARAVRAACLENVKKSPEFKPQCCQKIKNSKRAYKPASKLQNFKGHFEKVV